jgi:hypothetical protein
MNVTKAKISDYSRYGIIAAGLYLAMVFYYIIRGAACGTTAIDCSRPLFLLSLPFYVIVIPLISHFNNFIYAVLVLVSSTLYATGFYSLGEWIEEIRKRTKTT